MEKPPRHAGLSRHSIAGAAECATRLRISGTTVAPNGNTIHEYGIETRRELVRTLVRGAIDHRSGIEDDDIGEHARLDEPAIIDAKPRRGG
jgi:hypothetical protein